MYRKIRKMLKGRPRLLLPASLLLLFSLCFIANVNHTSGKVNSKNAVIDDITEVKEFKKLLRTKTNVLVMFLQANSKDLLTEQKIFREAAMAVRGTGTAVLIDCNKNSKLCKKLLKNSPAGPYVLKHYKDGDFHKDYLRSLSVSSIVNFMRDPTGELPWEEDPAGADVLHFTDYTAFTKHLRRDPRPMLVMFHVPWCGFCKRLKPVYNEVAKEFKSTSQQQQQQHLIAAMDVEKVENAPARRAFNITGFPTFLYFERGQFKQPYEGENTKDAIVAFMRNPKAPPASSRKAQEVPNWSADPSSEIVHLTTAGFEPAIQDEPSVLIMFYAPWCGHCQRLKPEYEKAAMTLKERKIRGVLAALDATKESAIAEQFKVKGYPTLKYFSSGVYKFDVNLRDAERIVEFMSDPREPPPPPPPELPWEQEEGAANALMFLDEESFGTILKRKKHAIVMFYAPWCGHCKNTKPEFLAAAQHFTEDTRVVFVAVDCTRHKALCATYEVRGYPTFKYFSYFKKIAEYNGGRTRQDFIKFMNSNPETTAIAMEAKPRSAKNKREEL